MPYAGEPCQAHSSLSSSPITSLNATQDENRAMHIMLSSSPTTAPNATQDPFPSSPALSPVPHAQHRRAKRTTLLFLISYITKPGARSSCPPSTMPRTIVRFAASSSRDIVLRTSAAARPRSSHEGGRRRGNSTQAHVCCTRDLAQLSEISFPRVPRHIEAKAKGEGEVILVVRGKGRGDCTAQKREKTEAAMQIRKPSRERGGGGSGEVEETRDSARNT